jgi:kynureninase
VDLSREHAESLDAADELAGFRRRFVTDDPELVYLDGNSLGRLPCATVARLTEVVEREWGAGLIRSWSEWIDLPRRVGDAIATGVLAVEPGEVVVADSTTVNLYKLASAALDLPAADAPSRRVVLTDDDNFPTDLYVLQGLCDRRGLELRVLHTDIDGGLTAADVAAALSAGLTEGAAGGPTTGPDVALAAFSHVAYRSGALADLPAITGLIHDAGALALWDLSHSAGAVPVPLAEARADLAVGCTYKYLNGGPGAPAYLYVRSDLVDRLDPPIRGWFGQRHQFAMGPDWDPATGIERFLSGTPSVLGLAAVEEGVRLLAEAGLDRLRSKGIALTSYLLELADAWLAPLGFRLATPRDPARRGAHVTVAHPQAWQVCQAMIAHSVVPDYRAPDRVRLGPAPLTTSFAEVWDGLDRLRRLVDAGEHERYPVHPGRVT